MKTSLSICLFLISNYTFYTIKLSGNPASLVGDALADDLRCLVLVGADDDVAGVLRQHDLHQLPSDPGLRKYLLFEE